MSVLFDKNKEPEPNGQDRYLHFKVFHRTNPEVFRLFERFARSAKDRGSRKYFGARMIGERIRWYTTVETESADDFRINDHCWPYYARLLMLKYSEFDGFFQRRDTHFDVGDEQLLKECGHV